MIVLFAIAVIALFVILVGVGVHVHDQEERAVESARIAARLSLVDAKARETAATEIAAHAAEAKTALTISTPVDFDAIVNDAGVRIERK